MLRALFYIYKNLTWSTKIKHLSLQMTKNRGMLHKSNDYVPISSLKMQYYSLIHTEVGAQIKRFNAQAQPKFLIGKTQEKIKSEKRKCKLRKKKKKR